jgi:hypothetical protein
VVSKTVEFVAELIRAANNLDKQNDRERKRLTEDAIIVIQHLRAMAGVATRPSGSDPIFELQFISAAITIGWATDTRVKLAFLEAAGTIRDLRMALDRRAENSSTPGTPDDP